MLSETIVKQSDGITQVTTVRQDGLSFDFKVQQSRFHLEMHEDVFYIYLSSVLDDQYCGLNWDLPDRLTRHFELHGDHAMLIIKSIIQAPSPKLCEMALLESGIPECEELIESEVTRDSVLVPPEIRTHGNTRIISSGIQPTLANRDTVQELPRSFEHMSVSSHMRGAQPRLDPELAHSSSELFFTPGSTVTYGTRDSPEPSVSSSAESEQDPPADFQERYASLLDHIVNSARSTSIPSAGEASKCTPVASLNRDTFDGLFPQRKDRHFKLGAAGELFVSKLLYQPLSIYS